MTKPTAAAARGITVLRGGVERIAATAAAAEAAGFGSVWAPEFYTRSAVVTLARMAGRTTTARVGSSIAYAVGRSPLTIATEARSLDEVAGGRLVLGLGTRSAGRSPTATTPSTPPDRAGSLTAQYSKLILSSLGEIGGRYRKGQR
jgi:alkanesulfonate monooxygenase SsuD/methylene tetrahydromethanopterin reductase-like flavin-dependent oxidoreductase (luciferase family)